MSFFKKIIGKDQPGERDPDLSREAAARAGSGQQQVPPRRPNKNAGLVPSSEEAISLRKPRIPTKKEIAEHNQVARAALNSGLVSQDMIDQALKSIENEAGTSLQKALVEHGWVREDDVLDALANELGMERVSLNDYDIDSESFPPLAAIIPKKVAAEFRVFPVRVTEDEVVVAICDPLAIQTIDDVQRIVGRPVTTVLVPEEEINRYYNRFYEGDEIRNIYENITDSMRQDEIDRMTDIELETESAEDAPPVVRFVDLIFKQAVHDRASDIHIEPTRTGLVIRFRIDGVLHEQPSPPKKWQNAILSRLKVLSGMDLAEKRIPQDGRIKLSLPDRKLDLRVSALPAIHGETIVMRILDQASVLLGLEDVGFLPDNITLFNELIRRPTGVILMTGPTGSGKTTTLYSALSTINTPEVKIVTIENPVEYMLEGVNQVQVTEEVGLSFAAGLRSILRQSPDVLLVGEMRDMETAEIGIRAALTGHLVFSTLHTNDAPSAPSRLIDMGVKPFLVASSLQAVVAQRLIRRLCASCKAPDTTVSTEKLQEVGASEEEIANRESLDLYKPVGCDRCSDTGYRGRTAIHEIMVVDARIRQMVINGESGFRLKRVAVRNGMRTLRMDGWEKVKLGQTTIDEIMRITQND